MSRPAGVLCMEAILADHVETAGDKEIVYSSSHLACYAEDIAVRLRGAVA